jgi:UDP-N-acetylglucosamine 2-epimerase (non-hydrolysing)
MKKKKNILVVFGTRPEAIKLAPLCHLLKKEKKNFRCKICVTGQHTEMLEQALKVFSLKSDFNLKVMKKNQDLSSLTSLIILKIRKIIHKNNYDLVIIHGDTTTSFATALSCFYENIPIAHVEAGLRTYDLSAPFPEELNRQLNSKLSKFHFSPTKENSQNLINEGVNRKNIYITGNTVIDALLLIKKRIDSNKRKKLEVTKSINSYINNDWQNKKFILVTGHRRENFGVGFRNICEAILKISLKYPNINIIYPVHLNPKVKKPVKKYLGSKKNIYLIKPLNYEVFIYLLSKCLFVLTDSGGIQEEAPSFSKPVLVMRDKTERKEGIKSGIIKLIGSKKETIFKNMDILLSESKFINKMKSKKNPYGNGKASKKILNILKRNL